MRKIKLFIFASIISLLISSCQGTREQELKKLDKLWGYCDNPHRELNELEYTTCKRKEMAKRAEDANMEPFSITDFLEKVNSGVGSGTGFANNSVNPYLWQGSIDVTSAYNLKIADATGGYIQTEWIYDENYSNKRCMIKIQIVSVEYISTGVKSNFICESKNQEIWSSDGKTYIDEQKMLTLKILEASQQYSSSALN